MRRVWVIAVLLLVGCGGGGPAQSPAPNLTATSGSTSDSTSGAPTEDDSASESPTDDPTDDPTASGSPTEGEATDGAVSIEQYAAVVAPVRDDWLDSAAAYTEKCDLAADETAICAEQMKTLKIEARAVTVKVGGAANPEARKYLGPPPAEIESLLADSIAASAAIAVAVADWNAGGCEAVDVECDTVAVAFGAALADLTDAMNRWEPYV